MKEAKFEIALTPEEAMVIQYELSKEDPIYRVFINLYAKIAKVDFDDSKISAEQIAEKLKGRKIEERDIPLEELIEKSMSWNNVVRA